jgi:hypothetical protein
MANVWIEVLDTPIDGHQKGEIFEIDEHYANRFVEHEKAQIVDAPVVTEPEAVKAPDATEPATDKATAKASAKVPDVTEPATDKTTVKASAKGL